MLGTDSSTQTGGQWLSSVHMSLYPHFQLPLPELVCLNHFLPGGEAGTEELLWLTLTLCGESTG